MTPRSTLSLSVVAALVAVGVAAGSQNAAGTGERRAQQRLAAARPASTGTFFTWANNAGAAIRVSISGHGNIVEFKSPNLPNNQYEHIGVGAFSEGYVLCYTRSGTPTNTWDTGSSESGFGAATTTTSPVRVNRSTSDGSIAFSQSFTFGAPEQKTLAIAMTVRNTSGTTLTNVLLSRQVDFDIDTGGSSGWSNFVHYHGRTNSSVMAWNDIGEAPAGRTSHAMLLRGINPLPAATTQTPKITSAILDSSCSPASLSGTVNGDFGDRIEYNLGNLAANQSKTVTVQYLRY